MTELPKLCALAEWLNSLDALRVFVEEWAECAYWPVQKWERMKRAETAVGWALLEVSGVAGRVRSRIREKRQP